jgi:hypothetical protein
MRQKLPSAYCQAVNEDAFRRLTITQRE